MILEKQKKIYIHITYNEIQFYIQINKVTFSKNTEIPVLRNRNHTTYIIGT